MYKIFVLLLSLAFSPAIFANEIFGFLRAPCDLSVGLPVRLQEGQITILTPEGQLKSLAVDELIGIGHYVLNDSPFDLNSLSKIDLSPYLKKIAVKDTDLVIKGFPYQFVDDTVFILDVRGARRVVGLEEIGRVEAIGSDKIPDSSSAKVLPELALPAGLSECGKKTLGLLPVRFLADKIQILETINNWDKGFQNLNDLAERSIFYPRPFLFDRHDRFGFFFFKGDKPESVLFPLSYSFVHGEDFRFQGQTSIGGGFDKIGPRALPMNILTTDLKFHFLHASFEGNLGGMGVGSSLYSKEAGFEEYAEKHLNEARGDIIFNHLALIGFDWSHWGLSMGPLFPTFYIQVGGESREANPQKSLPVLRLTWTGQNFRFKVSGASGRLKATSNLSKKSEVILGEAGKEASAESYLINFKYLRPGFEWEINEETKFSSDLVWVSWDYKETLNGKRLRFFSQQTSLLTSIRRSFGDYVSLAAFMIWMKPEEEGDYNSESYKRNETNTNFGGTLEFLF